MACNPKMNDVLNAKVPPVDASGHASRLPELVIITGMSGAGRTEAMHTFEDLGYFCVDNLPSALIGNLLSLTNLPGQNPSHRRIAVVCDARNGAFLNSLIQEIDEFRKSGLTYCILFLDADDDKLIARYKSSRRRHPLCSDGSTVAQGIDYERVILANIKSLANHVINTTNMLPQQLRGTINALFAQGEARASLQVCVYSFGFKHGAPTDADIVIDVRFLPNPYYDETMRKLTGLDKQVRDFVMCREETQQFLERWYALLDCVMPGYVKEGKQQLAIGVGCTGGQHRSVALAEATGVYLKQKGYRISVAHRDLKLAKG